ncbi:hypothetical protein GW758_02275 [Candidatus Falkowbacteria bacterium]|nr:hypothetical protein [Candidatus Falkowbacteria bacterium]
MKNKSLLIQLTIFFVISLALIILGSARNSQSSSTDISLETRPKSDKIEIMYFHASARCASCITLEEYLNEAVDDFFQDEIASGKISFQKVNIDLPENKELANKFEAVSSSLKINEIYDGIDHIEEDVRVWRYLGDKEDFKNYLKNRIESRLN